MSLRGDALVAAIREIVAPGLDPKATPLRQIAEEPLATLGADPELEEAFHFLEEQELERVPVVEGDGRLVGVLSHAVVERRLAEDRPAEDDEGLAASEQ